MLDILTKIAVADIANSDLNSAKVLQRSATLADMQAYLEQTRHNADLLEGFIEYEITREASQI